MAEPRACRPGSRRGVTKPEIVAAMLVVAVVGAVLLPSFGRPRVNNRQQKCAEQLRSIAVALHASALHGEFVLPSAIGDPGWTVPEKGTSMDTTSNIFSYLIFQGYISPRNLVTPAEPGNSGIVPDEDYALSNPPAAVDPVNALWDPAFNADFTDPARNGNMSYAHVIPAGRRRRLWEANYSAMEAILSNRGPQVSSTEPLVFDSRSLTLLIHGRRDAWEGNVAYNDGHVDFETSLRVKHRQYSPAAPGSSGPHKPDVLFADEIDDPAGMNAYLSIFRRAGETAAEYQAIWD